MNQKRFYVKRPKSAWNNCLWSATVSWEQAVFRKKRPSLFPSPLQLAWNKFSLPVSGNCCKLPSFSVHLDQKGYIACGTAGYQCMKALGSFRSDLIESSSETLLVLIEVSLTKKPWGIATRKCYNLLLGFFLLAYSAQEIPFPELKAVVLCVLVLYEPGKQEGHVRLERAPSAFQDENECFQFWFFLMTGVSDLGAYLWVVV